MKALFTPRLSPILVSFIFAFVSFNAFSQENFRILPYLQVYEFGKIQLTWFSESPLASQIIIKNSSGTELLNKQVVGEEISEIYYTSQERNQSIQGLSPGSWLKGEKSFRYQIQADLPAGIMVEYKVTLGGNIFNSSFKTPASQSNWDKIRFIALSDSETEPRGRVTNRAWYPGTPIFRPATAQLWKDKFGTTTEQGFELPNYMLSEKNGYAENLKIINSRNPDFMLMPGDLVQGGAYQPSWDEFFRHNAGEFDKGLSKYPIIPAVGNWEAFGGVSGGYGTNERGEFLPLVGRSRFHSYFQTPITDPLQKHRHSYYRVDYGPITILTLDSSNGTPDQRVSDFDGTTKLTGKQFTVPGTDTQENYTQAQYESYGGKDLSGFGPGTDQYKWLEENLKSASAAGKLIFVQYHHIAYSSGEHGVPMNHELSVGQVGTPMRVLNPLLEKFGVIAVLSGHDELFERSFVDEDGDGKGIHYYDVGVAGDGMRGEKREWLKNPLQTLNYNQYRKWTADQSSAETWNTSGAVPVLTDGGKHYGHLEVNLEKIKEGDQQFAKIKFTPVYSFPVLDLNYNLQRVERRVYADEVELKVLLKQLTFVPELKDTVALFLNAEGKALLTSQEFLITQPSEPFTYSSSKGFEFSCSNLGSTPITITSKNLRTGEERIDQTVVSVFDTIPPYFDAANATYLFDPVVGKVSISIADFDIVDFKDNCATNWNISQSRFEVTCADIYQNPQAPIWEFPVVLTSTDPSGNSYSRTVKVRIGNVIESKKVSITSLDPLTDDGSSTLRLGNELEYQVLQWTRNGQVIPGQIGKEITISSPGQYQAKIQLSTGCPVNSKRFDFESSDLPAEYTNDVNLILNGTGKVSLTPLDIFGTNEKIADEVILSQTNFDCADLGTQKVKITLNTSLGNDRDTYEFWINVIIKDTIAPVFLEKFLPVDLNFDKSVGELIINPLDFFTTMPQDNCGAEGITIQPSQSKISCADVDSERDSYTVTFDITVSDASGNSRSFPAAANLRLVESKKVSLEAKGLLFEGGTVELKLGNELEYTVLEWRKTLNLIPSETGKTLIVSEPGIYTAWLLLTNGCSVSSKSIEVVVNAIPFPSVKEIVELALDQTGKVTLKPEDVFVSWPPANPNLDIKLSQSEFTCLDIGEKQITIIIKDQKGQIWEEKTLVKVQDKIKPILIPKNHTVDFDVTIGTLALKPADFIAELTDNCGVKEVTINKTTATCEDLGKEISVAIRAVDGSGNVVEAISILTLNRIETKKVTLTGSSNFCEGEKGTLILNSDAPFEVIRWRKDGVEIEGQKGKILEVDKSGKYHAVIRYQGGCLSETNDFVVVVNPLPKGEIEVKGNVLISPASAKYQWFRNGELIQGAASRELTVNQMGEYTVELTNEAGCKAKLKAVEMTISGLGSKWVVAPEELKIYPNPATRSIEVEIISDQSVPTGAIRVFGLDGKDVTSAVKISKSGSSSFTFDLVLLANGTYLIVIEGDKQQVFIGRFVKNE